MQIQFRNRDGHIQTGRVLKVVANGMLCRVRTNDRIETAFVQAHQAVDPRQFWDLYRALGGQEFTFHAL